MFDNLFLLIIVIIVLWVGAFGYYIYTSRQQQNIADRVERLQQKLDDVEKENGR